MEDQYTNPGLGSEFLKQCTSYFSEVQGANDFMSMPGRFEEKVTTFWFPALKNGMPEYDESTWAWNFGYLKRGDYNIGIDIRADGQVTFREGDWGGVYLRLKLKHPFEMGEVLELIQQLTEETSERSSFQEMPWSSIIQEIFTLIPGEKRQRLLKFSWTGWAAKRPELLKPFRVFYNGDDTGLNQMAFSTWKEWLNRNGCSESGEFDGELKEDDLLFAPGSGFQGARTALQGYRPWHDDAPRLVVRLKPQQSRMYFIDFLEHTDEGEALFKVLSKDPEKLPQILNQGRVSYPNNRITQIRLGVELRVSKQAYEDKVRSLSGKREPAHKLQERYRQRTDNIDVLHTDYLAQIDEMQRPLPFLIEYPYRKFRRTNDRLLKIKYGQQLLNILIKLPLFLPLEEAHLTKEALEITAPIEAELTTKPLSDGGLLKCVRDLQALHNTKKISLPWFGRLLDTFIEVGEPHIAKIIEARNRFHHPPHDEGVMLRSLDSDLPPLINLFRNNLSGYLFVSPETQAHEAGKHVVTARILMGPESDFPSTKHATTAPYEPLPTGEIVVVKPDWTQAVPLSRFFKSQSIQSVSIDLGLFDRMVKGQPEFTFLRGLGQDLP